MKYEKINLWNGYKKSEKILISNILDKYKIFLKTGISQSTNFLNPYEVTLVTRVLDYENISYQVVSVHDFCEKSVLIFGKDIHPITIYKIFFKGKITHSDILGTLFSIGYEPEIIGDIFVEEGYFYLTNLTRLNKFLEENFYQIKHELISLTKVDEIVLVRERFSKFFLIISSRRIDHIVSLLSKCSRQEGSKLIEHGDVLLNYKEVVNGTIQLVEGDIFSIRKVGKFKLSKFLRNTKKQKEIVEIWKYQ